MTTRAPAVLTKSWKIENIQAKQYWLWDDKYEYMYEVGKRVWRKWYSGTSAKWICCHYLLEQQQPHRTINKIFENCKCIIEVYNIHLFSSTWFQNLLMKIFQRSVSFNHVSSAPFEDGWGKSFSTFWPFILMSLWFWQFRFWVFQRWESISPLVWWGDLARPSKLPV